MHQYTERHLRWIQHYLPLLRRHDDTYQDHSISLLGIRLTRQLFLVATTLGIWPLSTEISGSVSTGTTCWLLLYDNVHVVEIVTVTVIVTLILDLIRYISCCTFDDPRHVPFPSIFQRYTWTIYLDYFHDFGVPYFPLSYMAWILDPYVVTNFHFRYLNTWFAVMVRFVAISLRKHSFRNIFMIINNIFGGNYLEFCSSTSAPH